MKDWVLLLIIAVIVAVDWIILLISTAVPSSRLIGERVIDGEKSQSITVSILLHVVGNKIILL